MSVGIFDKVLAFFLMMTPISYMRGMALNNFDVKFFHVAIICLFIASLFSKQIREPKGQGLMGSFLGLCLFSAFMHPMGNVGSFVLNHAVNILLVSIGYFLIVQYCEQPKAIYKWIAGAALINMLALSFQKVGFNPFLTTTSVVHPGGIMGNAPRFTTYLAIISPIMLYFSWWLFAACLAYSLIGDPQCAVLGICAVIAFLKVENKKFKWGIIASLLVGIAIYYEHILTSVKIRAKYWGITTHIFAQRPLSGIGMSIYPGGQERVTAGHDPMINSSLFYFICDSGWLGIVWLFFMMKSFFKRFVISSHAGLSVLAILLVGIVEYPIEIKRLWFTMISLTAFFTIDTYKEIGNA